MGIARVLAVALLLLPLAALGKESASFKRTIAGVEVDWSAGTITAQAGSAADMRMPGPGSARPGAERRARAAAEEKLRATLGTLAVGQKLDDNEVIKRATVARIEYQSDGGVVLWLALRFADVVPAKPATVAVKVGAMPLEFAPTVVASKREARVGFATYRPAAEAPRDVVRISRDDKGRLVLPAAAANVDSLAGASLVIYLEKAP